MKSAACLLLLMLLILPIQLVLPNSVLAVPVKASSETTGSGGGSEVPSLVDMQVSQTATGSGKTRVTVVFYFSNNIGYYQDENKALFSLRDSAGHNLAFNLQFWPNSTDTRRREAEMTADLAPGLIVVAAVDAGIHSKNGQYSTSGGNKTITVQAFAVPTKAPSPTTKPTPLPTARPTASPTAKPTSKPTTRPTSIPTPIKKPTAAATSATTTSSSPTQTTAASSQTTEQTTPASTTAGEATTSTFPAWVTSEATSGTDTSDTTTTGSQPGGGGTGGGKSVPLQLSATNPADQTYDVPVDGIITLTFNKNVIYLEIRENNKQAITLWHGDTQVPAEILMADDQIEFDKRHDIIVEPVEPLETATAYTIRIADSLVAKSGAKLEQAVEIHFYTIGYHKPVSPLVWAGLAGMLILGFGLGGGLLLRSKHQKARRNSDAE